MLLDTSGLYCYLDRRDARHRDSVSLLDSAKVRLTHNYVLTELVAPCTTRGLDRSATIEFVTELAADPQVTVLWVDRAAHQQAMDFLRSRSDKNYSLCDAVSFMLMRERGVSQALTTDRHFDQEGFERLLPF